MSKREVYRMLSQAFADLNRAYQLLRKVEDIDAWEWLRSKLYMVEDRIEELDKQFFQSYGSSNYKKFRRIKEELGEAQTQLDGIIKSLEKETELRTG